MNENSNYSTWKLRKTKIFGDEISHLTLLSYKVNYLTLASHIQTQRLDCVHHKIIYTQQETRIHL